MKDVRKTKSQLLDELAELRQRVAEVEAHNTNLNKERSLLRLLIDTFPYPIYAKDTKSRFLVANEAVARLMNATPDDLLGKTDHDFFPNELAETYFTDEQTIIKTGQPLFEKDETVPASSGKEGWYLTSKVPFYDDQGNIQGIVGTGQNITERRRAEKQIRANVRFLEHLDQINRVIQQSNGVEQLLENVIEKVFTIFDCDRAWLLYPCDPDVPSFRVYWEKTRPEYPGANALKLEIPISPGQAQDMRDALAAENPVPYTAGTERPVSKETVTQFGVQAQMFMAVYPIVDKPWMFGMHQCSHARLWTPEEQRLFKEIGQRLGDALSTLLTLRNLQESETKLREAQQLAHIGNWWWDVKSGAVEWSEEVYNIFRLNPDEFTPQIDSILALLPWVGDHECNRETIQEVMRKAQASHEPGSFEQRFFCPDGSIGHYFSTFQGIYDDDGELIAIKGTAQDITERRQAEQAREVDKSRYKGLFEQTNDAVYIVSLEDTFLAVNQRGADMLGYTVDELVGQSIEISAADSEQTEATDVLTTLKAGGVLPVYERTFKKKNGKEFPAEVNVALVKDPDGQPLHIQSVVRDISERKLAEAALRASEEKYRLLFDSADVLVSVYNREGVCLLMNRKVATLFGGEPEDFIGKSFHDLHPEAADEYIQRIRQAIDSGTAQDYENAVIFPSGNRWLLSRVHPIPDASGVFQTAQIISHDITERKQAEQALSESEERYRITSELISDYAFAWAINPDGSRQHLWTTDDSFTRVTGYSWKEIAETLSLYHPDDEAVVQQHVAETLQGQSTEGEYRIFTKSGDVRWINLRRQPIWDEQEQRVTRYYGVAQDITERKLAEQALHSQRDLGLYLSTTSDLADAASHVLDTILQIGEIDCGRVYLVDPVDQSHHLIAHRGLPPEFIALAGYYSKETPQVQLGLSTKPVYRLYDELSDKPKDAIRRSEGLRAAAVIPMHFKGRVIATLSLASHTHDTISERTRHVLETIAAQIGGSIAHIQAKEALRESEERYRIISELISDYAFAIEIKPDGTWNQLWITEDSFTRLTGYPWQEASEVFQLYHPDDKAIAQQHVAKTLQGESTEGEYRIITKSGEIRWINLRRQPIWDEQENRVTGHYGVGQDITERKRAEKALRLNSFALEHAADAIYWINKAEIIDVNEAACQMLGYSREEFSGMSLTTIDPVMPEPDIINIWEYVKKEGVSTFETQHKTKDGRIVPVEIMANYHEFEGKGLNCCFVRDITERKQAQMALQESEQKFRTVVQNAQAIIFILDNDGIFLLSEGQALTNIGLAPGQVVGLSAFEIYKDNPLVLEGIKQALAGELVHVTNVVQDIIFDVIYSPFYNSEGMLTGVIGIAIDITERQQAENELRERNHFIDTIIENSPIGFAINTIDEGQVVLASTRFSDIYGHPLESIRSVDEFFEMVYPDAVFREHIREQIMTDIASGDPSRMHWENIPITTSIGEQRVITATNIPLLEQNLMISTVQDVTEHARAEEAREENERRYKGLFEQTNDAIFIINLDSVFLDVNQSAADMLAYTIDELVGQPVQMIAPPIEHTHMASIPDLLIAGETIPVYERIFKKKTGEEFPVEVNVTLVAAPDGKPLHFQSVVRDITERKQIEQQRLELALEKERSDTLHMLMGNIAHDIKTPLAIINTSLYLLEKHTDPVKQQEKLNNIKGQVRILGSFIQDLVAIARLDSEPELRLVPVDVNELVMGIETETQPIIEQKQITFTLDLAEDMHPIQADQTDLRRALTNLVENALNYTPAGHTITVRTRKQSDKILVEVTDTGIGIHEKDLPHIFDRFYRSPQAQSILSGGSGLGLAIVQRVVEMHGGTVEVTSEPNTGTTFCIQLPLI